MSVEEIKNFIQVNERLGTGGQPTEDQVRDVAGAGYEAVVNLGLLGQGYSLPDEAGLVQSLGLGYRHIPVDFQGPTQDDFDAFVGAMDEVGGKAVFVHCAANYRVACFVGLYGEARLGWTREQADTHIARIWQPDEIWSPFIDEARKRIDEAQL